MRKVRAQVRPPLPLRVELHRTVQLQVFLQVLLLRGDELAVVAVVYGLRLYKRVVFQ